LFFLQELDALVARSSTDRISWPLVSYCDNLWRRFFKDGKTKIFYSVTSEHNYSILPFSQCLSTGVRDLLPAKVIGSLTKDGTLYCLQLASAENANLPLYANISHEFGHAIYDAKEAEVIALLDQSFAGAAPAIIQALEAEGATELLDRAIRVGRALVSLAQELFCDLVGALLMGPAFFLSLYEIGWGGTKAISSITLAPDEEDIRAYPSFHFRLHCIKRFAKIADFCTSAKSAFGNLDASLRPLADCLNSIPVNHESDTVRVLPEQDADARPIEKVFTSLLAQIKTALDNFLSSCNAALPKWFPNAFPPLVASDVAALLERLQNGVLPNIIPTPENPLLGKPADFMSILNACALYRQQILSSHDASSFAGLCERSSYLERLTSKAFEVSFIQHEYNSWAQGIKHGRPK
jgi:hypothetical protein